MWKSGWAVAALVTALCLAPARLSGQARPPASAPPNKSVYEQLDDVKLANTLRSYGMTELLEALVKSSAVRPEAVKTMTAEEIKAVAVLIEVKLAAASKKPASTQPAVRAKLVDEALALQKQVVDATATGASYAEKMQYVRFELDRIITLGITKVEPYAHRILILQSKPEDAAAIEPLTKEALDALTKLQTRIDNIEDRGANDDVYVIEFKQQMEALKLEARYRGAWIRFYRGMVLPPESNERATLLKQTIDDVKDFANAADNSSTVKFTALLLSGMAARELGDLKQAQDFLQRAANKEAGPLWQLNASFEKCHAMLEQGSLQDGEKAIADFQDEGAKLVKYCQEAKAELEKKKQEGFSQVAVDLQATLLKNHLYERAAAKAGDPKEAARLRDQALKAMLGFTEKYPQFASDFMGLIAPKYEGKEPKDIPPAMLVPMARTKINENTPESLTKAESYLLLVLNAADSSAELKSLALWWLGHTKNLQKAQLDAAKYFRRLAEQDPKNPYAKDAATNAVRCLQAVMLERKAEAINVQPSPVFAGEFVKSLEVLLALLARDNVKDGQIPAYYFELGTTLSALGRDRDAMNALGKIPATHELYLPARYRLLKSGVGNLRTEDLKPDVKRQRASALIDELRAYRNKAAEFVAGADKAQAEQAKAWAAESDLLVAELMNDPLEQTAQAIQEAQDAIRRWPGNQQLERLCQELIVRVHLKRNELKEAIDLIQGIKGAEELVGRVVYQMRTLMDQLEMRSDADSVKLLADYRAKYRTFAERLYDGGVARKANDAEMYRIRQALADALDTSDNEADVRKALGIYEDLQKINDKDYINFRGLAQCYDRLKQPEKAMKFYDMLIDGLPEKTPEWWRVQVERLNFVLKNYADAETIKQVALQVRMLRQKDSNLGGYLKQFNDIETRANQMLKGEGGK